MTSFQLKENKILIIWRSSFSSFFRNSCVVTSSAKFFSYLLSVTRSGQSGTGQGTGQGTGACRGKVIRRHGVTTLIREERKAVNGPLHFAVSVGFYLQSRFTDSWGERTRRVNVHWTTEPLNHWTTEPLNHWTTEPLNHWTTAHFQTFTHLHTCLVWLSNAFISWQCWLRPNWS